MHVLRSSAASQRIQLADGKPGVRYSASKTRGLCSWPSRLGRAEVDIAKCSRSLSSCLLHCTQQTPNPIHLIICLARNRSQLRRRQPPACPPHHLPNPSSLPHAVGCQNPPFACVALLHATTFLGIAAIFIVCSRLADDATRAIRTTSLPHTRLPVAVSIRALPRTNLFLIT